MTSRNRNLAALSSAFIAVAAFASPVLADGGAVPASGSGAASTQQTTSQVKHGHKHKAKHGKKHNKSTTSQPATTQPVTGS